MPWARFRMAGKVEGCGQAQVGSLDSTASTFVLEARSNAVYHDGYLLFVRKGILLAQPFDLETVKLTGEGVPLAEQVLMMRSWRARCSRSRQTVPWSIKPVEPLAGRG